ncbi:MAG TPA: SPW repeat protein, partial [Rhizomicrobium sp.]
MAMLCVRRLRRRSADPAIKSPKKGITIKIKGIFSTPLPSWRLKIAIETSSRRVDKNVQDWINLVCGVLLFVSPWVLSFTGDLMAARTAW